MSIFCFLNKCHIALVSTTLLGFSNNKEDRVSNRSMCVFFVTSLSISRLFILLIRIALHEFIYGSLESLELEEIKEGYEVFIYNRG
jgi:hypothetical protein